MISFNDIMKLFSIEGYRHDKIMQKSKGMINIKQRVVGAGEWDQGETHKRAKILLLTNTR